MNGSRHLPRTRRRRDLMELVARARPARLDADDAAGWPDARALVAAYRGVEHAVEPLLPGSPPGHRDAWPHGIRRPRLWAAALSATTTAAIIVVLVAITQGEHAPGPGPDAPAATGQPGPVSFRVLQLANGWRPGASTIRTGEPAYGTSGNGIVCLSGSLSRSTPPTGSNGTFAILPKGLRPIHQQDVTVTTVGGTTAMVQITTDGQLAISGLNAARRPISLDGVCIAVDG